MEESMLDLLDALPLLPGGSVDTYHPEKQIFQYTFVSQTHS